MPRQARHVLSGRAHHLTHRGVNKQPCFRDDRDRLLYLGLLEEISPAAGCGIHAFALMPNHVHLLVTPDEGTSLALFMKRVAQAYSQRFNRKYQRTGPVWEGRFKSSTVDDEAYLMRCYRYIELNPVRAGLTDDPAEYPWTSYRSNGAGAPSWIEPHALYTALGKTTEERARNYREFVAAGVEASELLEIRAAVRAGLPLAICGSATVGSAVGTSRGTSPG